MREHSKERKRSRREHSEERKRSRREHSEERKQSRREHSEERKRSRREHGLEEGARWKKEAGRKLHSPTKTSTLEEGKRAEEKKRPWASKPWHQHSSEPSPEKQSREDPGKDNGPKAKLTPVRISPGSAPARPSKAPFPGNVPARPSNAPGVPALLFPGPASPWGPLTTEGRRPPPPQPPPPKALPEPVYDRDITKESQDLRKRKRSSPQRSRSPPPNSRRSRSQTGGKTPSREGQGGGHESDTSSSQRHHKSASERFWEETSPAARKAYNLQKQQALEAVAAIREAQEESHDDDESSYSYESSYSDSQRREKAGEGDFTRDGTPEETHSPPDGKDCEEKASSPSPHKVQRRPAGSGKYLPLMGPEAFYKDVRDARAKAE